MSRLRPKNNIEKLLLVSLAVYILILSTISISKHYTFQTSAWDLGIYEQVLWSTANHGELFWYSVELPINQGGSFFGIHFSPFLFLIIPFYWVFQSTEALLVLQTIFVALGAVPLYLIAREETNERAALVFSILYLIYPPLHGMNLHDFHVQAFLPFTFFSAFYFFKNQRWRSYLFFIVLSMMTIEFVPIITIFIGLYGLWTCRRELLSLHRRGLSGLISNRRFLVSMLTIILSLSWFMMARQILFFFNPSPRPHPGWSEFGDPIYDLQGFLVSIISDPLHVIRFMVQPLGGKIYYLVVLFAPIGFMSFLSPPTLLIGTPWFLASLLSSYENYYNPIGYQWVGFVIPFIFISALYGSKRFMKILQSRSGTHNLLSKVNVFHRVTTSKLFLGMILLTSLFLASLGSGLPLPIVTHRHHILEDLIALVPSNSSVLTQNDIFPHLSKRLNSYVGSNPVGNYSHTVFDYVLVDTKSKWYIGGHDFSQLPLNEFVQEALNSGDYGFVTAVDGIWMLKKDFEGKITFPTEKGILGKFSLNNSITRLRFETLFLDTDWDWKTEPPFPRVADDNSTWWVVFTACLNIHEKGTYEFHISTTGDSRVFIEDALILNSNGLESNEIFLNEGFHSLKIEYNSTGSFDMLKLMWNFPLKSSSAVISYENLFWNVSQS